MTSIIHSLKASRAKENARRRRNEEELKERLCEADETREAIRNGDVDTVVVSGSQGDTTYTLRGADSAYRVMVDAMLEGAVTLDKDGLVLYCNKAFGQMLDRPLPAILGRPFKELVLGALHTDFEYFLEVAVRFPQRKQFILERRDGAAVPVSLSSIALETGGIQDICMVVYDLSAQKIAEKEREEAFRDVEKKVLERTRDLRRANQELEAFSYSVSHDLRNPLNAILVNAELIGADSSLFSDSITRQAIGHITESAKRMAQVISDLMVLSNISRAAFRHESVILGDLAHRFREELTAPGLERNVTWVIGPNLALNADPGLMKILMENLLRNAWKYSSKRKDARIEVGAVEQNGQRVFFVRDNGVGFDMKDVGKLFKPYQRLHAHTEFKGTGIGLAIVKRIVDRHGGVIWAEGEKDKGATFYFQLP